MYGVTLKTGVASIDGTRGGLAEINADDRQQSGDGEELGKMELVKDTDVGPVLRGECKEQARDRQSGPHEHEAIDDVSEDNPHEVA